METRLYTRTNPDNGQIEIKHYLIDPNARPDDIGPVFETHFWGTGAPTDFFADWDHYVDDDVLCHADIYGRAFDGPLPEFLAALWKERDSEGWVLLPTPEPHEYTCAGSPVAVLRVDGSNLIEIAALPGARTVEGSLQQITLEQALALIASLTDAVGGEKWA
jgi:hypothetical protein